MKELSLEVLQYLASSQVLAFSVGATIGILLVFLISPAFSLVESGITLLSKAYERFAPATETVPDFDEKAFYYYYREAYSEQYRSKYGSSNEGNEREDLGSAAKEVDPYQILGLKASASKDEIRKAYREAVKLYHPDKYQSLPPKLRESSTEITKALNAAYRVLKSRGLIE
jgi:hypothetical protein